jgi:hypothetical protein
MGDCDILQRSAAGAPVENRHHDGLSFVFVKASPRRCQLALVAVVLVPAAVASAHPDVDRGRELAVNAEFEAALAAFDEAEAAADLTRQDLVELLAARAYVHYAMESVDALERDVLRLATLAPDHTFDVTVPPEVQDMHRSQVAGLEEPLALEAETIEEVPGTLTVRAHAVGDVGHLVRSVQVFARVGTTPEWSHADRTLSLPVRAGDEVEYYAEAVGPGGAVVASAGSLEAPMTTTARGAATPPIGGAAAPADEESGVPVWALVAGGAGVAALAIVLAIVLFGGESLTDNTQPSAPVVVRGM